MFTFYKIMYISSIIVGIILVILAIFLFLKSKVCFVIKELRNTKEENDIKKLLQNTVLLNPQIQEDVSNIEGYNDLLAFYFKVLKEEEKKREHLLNQIEKLKEKKSDIKRPTYHEKLVRGNYKGESLERYSVKVQGTSRIVK